LNNVKTPSQSVFFRWDCVDVPCRAAARLRKSVLSGEKSARTCHSAGFQTRPETPGQTIKGRKFQKSVLFAVQK
jgi:hypothetical protein